MTAHVGMYQSMANAFAYYCKRNLLAILTLLAVLVGVIAGVLIQRANPDLTKDDLLPVGLNFPGELLLRALHLIVLPLVVTCLIIGLSGNKSSKFNKQAGLTILYYLSTTIIAAIIGLILVSVIEPGVTAKKMMGGPDVKITETAENAQALDVIGDLIRNFVPDNLVAVAFQKRQTQLESKSGINGSTVVVRTGVEVDGINMLGVISVSIAVGIVIMANRAESGPVLDFFVSLHFITLKLTEVILWYSPIGIMFLVMSQLSFNNIGLYMASVGMYMITVLVGLSIHLFLVLPGIYFGITKKNPFVLYKHMLPAAATAFGTASSAVTIPVTMDCVKKAGVDATIVDTVIPVGATINMDGTALYEAVACVFIAQLSGIQLTNAQLVITALTATVAAIGAAGIPSAGLVTMVMVLNAVGLDTTHIASILAIDWLLDRFRTMINVIGDGVGCAVVEKLTGPVKSAQEMNGDVPLEEAALLKKSPTPEKELQGGA